MGCERERAFLFCEDYRNWGVFFLTFGEDGGFTCFEG